MFRSSRWSNAVIEKVFRTHDLPASDRFDFWCDLISRTHAPLELDSAHRYDFQAEQRLLDFGDVLVWPTTFQPVRFIRTPKLIRQSDPEGIHVSLPLQGILGASQNDHEIVSEPSTLCVINTSRPLTVTAGEDGRAHSGIGLEVPRALLPLSSNRADRLIPCRIPAQHGIAALLAQFLHQVTSDASSYTPSDGPRIAVIVVDLLSAVFAGVLDDDQTLPPESRRRTLTLRIRAFIRQNLRDPHLAPASIAAAHHISISYLHRLFQDQGDTVSAFIRRQRLERVRHDLSDPGWSTAPIHDIAARWGFDHYVSFSRAFRAAYRLPPRDYRQRAQRPEV
ncbi:helix-turn-helix domain-containing protein [Streptomyces sp. NPDC059010]|uniref:AraC-like ligand-binding domain-containing protein n=1 Tax=Streptomyces sp. NPDC059010 TaxID=3346695 RepID=UPI0036BF95FA